MSRSSGRTRDVASRIVADKQLLIIVGLLLLIGIILVYDATAVSAQSTFGNAYRFVFQQLAWVLLGGVGFLFFYKVDYASISKLAYVLFVISLLLLTPLALFGFLSRLNISQCVADLSFMPCVNGAYRWIYINGAPLPQIPFLGIVGFQPGEFAKLALVLYLAVQLDKTMKRKKDLFFVFFVTSLLVTVLVLFQPNMSTAMLLFLIGCFIYFSSGAPLRPFFISLPFLVLFSISAILLSSYRRARLLAMLGFNKATGAAVSYHAHQILIALGSGGFWGVGFGQSRQKYQYLPEVAADSIFAILGEELGFVGTVSIIVLFFLFIHRGYTIAASAPDLLGRLLAVGITSWIGLQFFINVAAMVKLAPLTGIPLPFISYGGSSIIFSLMGIGILANVSKKT